MSKLTGTVCGTVCGVPKTKALTLYGMGRAELNVTGAEICVVHKLRKWVIIESLGNDITPQCIMIKGIA